MQLSTFPDSITLAHAAAEIILKIVKENPAALICCASGETPLPTFKALIEVAKEEKADFSGIKFIALDEWIGIGPLNSGSCQYFLKNFLTDPLNLKPSQLHFFNALSSNLAAECLAADSFIRQHGGLDLILVGVGLNGHIGLNEPGVSPDLYSHVIELDPVTAQVGQKYFTESTPLTRGITLGLKHFSEAKKAIVMATGRKKSEVMKKVLTDPISPQLPATIVRTHPDGIVMLDQDAASLLE
jgi:glucosamine-6-phosphate isomerase